MSGLWRFADLAVATDIEFPGLDRADGPAQIEIRRGVVPPDGWTAVQTWSADADDWLHIDRGPDGYRLRFTGLTCRVSPSGVAIVYDPDPGVPAELIVHLLLHQVLPLAVSRAGRFVVHACAIATPHGVVALVGDSGAGKSTLAAACCARGASLVADDALVIDVTDDGVIAWPTADGLRLWDDMAVAVGGDVQSGPAAGKRRLPVTLARGRAPLTQLVLVGDTHDSGVVLARVPPPAARVALLPHLFRLDVEDAGESRRLLDEVDRLARRVPVQHLAFPDGVDHLGPAAAAVLALLERP